MKRQWLAVFLVLWIVSPALAQETHPKKKTDEYATIADFLARMLKLLRFENDPAFDPVKQFDQVVNILKQIEKSSIKPAAFSQKIVGEVAPGGKGDQAYVEAKKEPATVGYQVVVSAPGKFEVSAQLQGGTQYWTLQGAPTFFMKGADGFSAIRVEGTSDTPGIKRFTVSIPEGGRLGAMEFKSSAARPLLPEEEIRPAQALDHRFMLKLFARVLGKMGRLPMKAGASALEVHVEEGKRNPFKPWKYKFRITKPGAYVFRLSSGAVLRGAALNGKPVSSVLPGLPTPEGEEDGKAIYVSLPAGDHELDVPLGSSSAPILQIGEQDESGEVYATLLGREGFTVENLDARVSSSAMNLYVDRLDQVLHPQLPGEKRVEYLYNVRNREREWFQRNLDLQFVNIRSPVSPVTPPEGE